MTSKIPEPMRAALRRMDPAELVLVLADRGVGLVRLPAETYEDWLEREQRVILAAGHKARLAAGRAFSGAERAESRDWLLRNGFRGDRFDA